MKRIFLSLVIAFMFSSAYGQVVRIGVLGLGFSNESLGLHIMEASYAPKPRFDVGAYIKSGIGGSEDGDTAEGTVGVGMGVQGKFYLLTGTVKPFVGLQVGPRFGASGEVDLGTGTGDGKAGVSLEVTPQVGLRFGPLNIWGSYENQAVQGNIGFVFGFGNFDKVKK